MSLSTKSSFTGGADPHVIALGRYAVMPLTTIASDMQHRKCSSVVNWFNEM